LLSSADVPDFPSSSSPSEHDEDTGDEEMLHDTEKVCTANM
jgi:hypothetical protein